MSDTFLNNEINERINIGKKAGMIGIISNLFLAGLKLTAGILTSSVSIMADALNNFTDAGSSIITLVGFRLSERPADNEHPYGHARSEYLAALIVAMLILVIGFELALNAGRKIFLPQSLNYSKITIPILVCSILIKSFLSYYYYKKGNQIKSKVLSATSVDCRNDVFATLSVIMAILMEYYLDLQADGIIGLGVALFIIYSGIKMACETFSPLLGEGAGEELRKEIESFIMAEEKVVGCHDLMVHDYGPGKRFASIHVEIDKDEDAIFCHEILDNLERQCERKTGVKLVIHYDPVITDDPELERLRRVVYSLIAIRDERLTVHDFRMVQGKENVNLIFDIVLPSELRGKEEEIRTTLENAINNIEEKKYFLSITFDVGF